jgi:hypothetical protein
MKLPKMKVPGAKGKERKWIQKRYEKKVKEYAAFLLDDGDYDWGSTLRMLRFKLERMRDHVLEHKMFVGYEKIAAEIDNAVKMLRRIEDDPYHDEVFAKFYKKHGGRPELIFGEKNEDGNYPAEFIYANGKPATEAMSKEQRKLFKLEARTRHGEVKAAFKYIGENLMRWWC